MHNEIKETCYISGPYTHPDPVENTHNTFKVADAVLEAGFIPYVPHATLIWHLISPKPYQTWLEYDLEWVRLCDRFLRLPGESHGADIEEAFAKKLHKPIAYSLAQLQSGESE